MRSTRDDPPFHSQESNTTRFGGPKVIDPNLFGPPKKIMERTQVQAITGTEPRHKANSDSFVELTGTGFGMLTGGFLMQCE